MTFNPSKIVRAVAVMGALSVILGGAANAQDAIPGLGTWKLNVAKSRYSPGPAPKNLTVTFSAAGQGVKAVIDGVGSEGSKTHWEYTANFDGKPHPVTGNADGDMVVVRRVNATTIETSYSLKGKPTVVNTRVVSADGKTLTVTSTGTNALGQKINNTQVFERE
jgi:hypothetical protein